MTKVSLVRTTNRAEGVTQAIKLLQHNPIQGKVVTLKPNFNSADECPGSTHIDTLRALILNLKEMGARKIVLAERSGPGDTTHNIMEKKGVFALAKEIGFDIVNLEELPPEGWVQITPKDGHWKNGFPFPRVYTQAESIVQTCCLKTHQFGGHFTLSLKLAVGMVPGGGLRTAGPPWMPELHRSPDQRKMIAEINTAFKPDLIVLDGVLAFVDGGPHKGTLKEPGVILAGTDRIAIDAVGVSILRSLGTTPEVSRGRVFEQDQIARAVELGLGVTSPDLIQLVTDGSDSKAFAEKIGNILYKG
jgi:uncharacterized protein (DUF362 family)